MNKWNNLNRASLVSDFNVLSCFDGMSCGQIALNKLNAVPTKYFASEIDKYAMSITQKNFPDTIQVGDIVDIDVDDLPRIDLLIGGSPCQGFSFAGDTLNFADPRSLLFFEFHRLYKQLKLKNPNLIFLLENVRMHKKSQDVISKYMGVEPIMINSALVSAQNRKRLYWTNIRGIQQPHDRGLILNNILDDVPDANPTKNTKRNREHHRGLGQKALTMTATMFKGAGNNGMSLVPQLGCKQVGMAEDIKGFDQIRRIYSPEGKSPAVNACTGGNRAPKVAVNAPDGSKNLSLTRDTNQEYFWRVLTPTECERLQTVPEGYTEGVSNTQRYKMLGNGWTVNVIEHIFKQMLVNEIRRQTGRPETFKAGYQFEMYLPQIPGID